ncbi:unnamed protein product [Aphanomyces euteiches]
MMAQDEVKEECEVHMTMTSFGSMHESVVVQEEVDFLDFRTVFASSPGKPDNHHVLKELEESTECANPSSAGANAKLFSPLRVIYSPSRFFKSPVIADNKSETYTLSTPIILKKPTKSAAQSTEKASPFSGWKVEPQEKTHLRLMLSPACESNEDDNRSFLSFAQSLPAITDLNNLDSSPSVTVSPLTPDPPLTKLEPGSCYGKDRTPDTDTECPRVTQRLDFHESPTFETSFPNIHASTSTTPGKNHRSGVGTTSVTLHVVDTAQAKSIKSINDSLRKGKSVKPNKNAKAFKALCLSDDDFSSQSTPTQPKKHKLDDDEKPPPVEKPLSERRNMDTSFLTPSDDHIRKKARLEPPLSTPVIELSQSSTSSEKKRNPCNCKKSQCMKLYCECFASGGYCDENCKCVGCHNTSKFESVRKEAIALTLERNPNAFKPKINVEEKQDCKNHGQGVKTTVLTPFLPDSLTEVKSPFGDFRTTIMRPEKARAVESTTKRKLVVYPLFGPNLPPVVKDVAVHILNHLDGSDIYNASIVSRLWNGMAMSEDIWDYTQLHEVP